MRLFLRAARLAVCAGVVATAAMPACFNAGNGTPPPMATFYYPTGLAVSTGGNVLYAINSDFDLQWNGGTLQSYNLFQIRHDAASLIQTNVKGLPAPGGITQLFIQQPYEYVPGACPGSPPPPTNDLSGIGVPLGEACAPPVDSTKYVQDSAIVGAFATDLQLSAYPYGPQTSTQLPLGTRLFAPVAGNATVTWADVAADDPNSIPPGPLTPSEQSNPLSQPPTFAPFQIDCGTRVDSRCSDTNETGNNPVSLGNTRNATLPGEPFGLAQSQDATALVVTSETSTETSLLTSGMPTETAFYPQPTMQFVLPNMPNGGVGVTAVPHDPLAGQPLCELVGDQAGCVRQAFLQTSRQSAELDLLRYYDDDGSCLPATCVPTGVTTGAAVYRPFLEKERAYTITSNGSGTDFRGAAIDISNRLQCKATATNSAELQACAQLSARLFIASRTPPSIVVGKVGFVADDGTFDPDQVTIIGNVSVAVGASRLYLAPIAVTSEIDDKPHYQMMLFVVCFDSNEIWVYNVEDLDSPTTAIPYDVIVTGTGPYAMAFDPFSIEDAATGAVVPIDPRQPASLGLTRYRFAYVASFTHSYVQLIDLLQPKAGDESLNTFGSVVYTLGKPVPPKGSGQGQ
jgi:hypothetical protein